MVPAILALLMCLHGIADKPLWLDEVTTYHRANLPLFDLFKNSLQNKHLPIYFLIEMFFDSPTINEELLRLPSAFAVSLVVLFVSLIGSELSTPLGGFSSGLLAAIAPVELQFAQEARPYALAACFVMIALWGFLRLLRSADSSAAREMRMERIGLMLYFAGSTAAVNTLVVCWAWVLIANVVAFISFRKDSAIEFKKSWLLLQALLLALSAPGLFGLYHFSAGDPFEGHKWVPESTVSHIWTVLASTYFFRVSNVSNFSLIESPFP